MRAIIPAAGHGTRLRPLTHTRPKALLPVGTKPIIGHIVDMLIPLGCDSMVFIISETGHDIPAYVKDHYPDIDVNYVVQRDRLGLGHAVYMTREIASDDELIIIYGDTIVHGDYSAITNREADALIGVKEVDDPRRFGVVNQRDGLITRFVEKPDVPESNQAIVGLNYFKDPVALFDAIQYVINNDIKTKNEYQITDAFQVMVDRGLKMKAFEIDEWFDCGTPETLLTTNRYMLDIKARDRTLDGSVIIPPVSLPESVTVTNAIIGPYVSVGENAVIENAIISNSIIGTHARVSGAILTSSLVGDSAEVVKQQWKVIIGDHSRLDFAEQVD